MGVLCKWKHLLCNQFLSIESAFLTDPNRHNAMNNAIITSKQRICDVIMLLLRRVSDGLVILTGIGLRHHCACRWCSTWPSADTMKTIKFNDGLKYLSRLPWVFPGAPLGFPEISRVTWQLWIRLYWSKWLMTPPRDMAVPPVVTSNPSETDNDRHDVA